MCEREAQQGEPTAGLNRQTGGRGPQDNDIDAAHGRGSLQDIGDDTLIAEESDGLQQLYSFFSIRIIFPSKQDGSGF